MAANDKFHIGHSNELIKDNWDCSKDSCGQLLHFTGTFGSLYWGSSITEGLCKMGSSYADCRGQSFSRWNCQQLFLFYENEVEKFLPSIETVKHGITIMIEN